jgi:glycosyltransferase involved in cell wall biosynthesis
MDLNIVIPVFNEGANIAKTLGKIAESMHDAVGRVQVTIVYDFDEDNTLPVVEFLRANYPFPLFLQKNPQRGVCSAIREGLLASSTTFVLITMADMSDDYDKLPRMLDIASTQGWDIVCGSRYVKGGHQFGGPLLKKTLSRLAGLSLHWLSRIPTHDITNSYKLYRRSIFNTIRIESTGGFEIGIEIVVKAFTHGMRITEVPCSWWDRSDGESRFKMAKWLPLYLRWYFYALQRKKA